MRTENGGFRREGWQSGESVQDSAAVCPDRPVAVLYARADSVYKSLGADVWDEARDARLYEGPHPVVAHPPCRGWGRLRHLSTVEAAELELGLHAVSAVRAYGGVLEHPHASALWDAAGLPRPGFSDAWGGYTLLVRQCWWGHPAPKPTWLYVCHVARPYVPPFPATLLLRPGRTTAGLCAADRERTPVRFAAWLLALARGVDFDCPF